MSPASDCELSSSENIEVTIKNYASDTFDIGDKIIENINNLK